MRTALIFGIGLLVLGSILPLWRHPHWSVRGMDFPRLQLSFFAVLLLVLALLVLDLSQPSSWLLLAVTLAGLIWQSWWIVPYTRIWPVEVKDASNISQERTLSILTANVLTTNRDAEALLRLVEQHKPDILATLESDQWWQTRLDTLLEDMPYAIKCPQDNLYGMHVYSRLPLHDSGISYLVEQDVPSMHALVELRSGDNVRLHVLHPAPPSPVENTESTERDAELIVVARNVAESPQPIVVTGDLNDVAWSATTRLFRKISRLLDPRVGRGIFNTFHADYRFLRWPLDHVFHSRHFTLVTIMRLPSIGSDHFPLLAKLFLEREQPAEQAGLSASSHDHERARSIVAQTDASESDVASPGRG